MMERLKAKLKLHFSDVHIVFGAVYIMDEGEDTVKIALDEDTFKIYRDGVYVKRCYTFEEVLNVVLS